MNWKRFLHPPLLEREGNKVFTSGVVGGIAVMILALSGVVIDGQWWERLAAFGCGACLTVGCAGTLALAYAELEEDSRFALKAVVRVAFLFLGPALVLCELSWLLEEVGIWGCIGICAITVIPFGLSLIWLILKKRKSH